MKTNAFWSDGVWSDAWKHHAHEQYSLDDSACSRYLFFFSSGRHPDFVWYFVNWILKKEVFVSQGDLERVLQPELDLTMRPLLLDYR